MRAEEGGGRRGRKKGAEKGVERGGGGMGGGSVITGMLYELWCIINFKPALSALALHESR